MAELVFFTGTMDCGKSTLAMQIDHNHRARGRAGRVFTAHDRAGEGRLSSRLGLMVAATEVTPELDFRQLLVQELSGGARIDYLICDEAMFYTGEQVEQLARVVDDLALDVFAFGLTTDFRTRLFPGSQRLLELADRVETLQVEALCWCGRRGTHNARTVGGVMVVEGEQVVVGDTAPGAPVATEVEPVVGYEVLCRRHHLRGITAARGGTAVLSPEPLPFPAAQSR
ncbi:thymidine kinase [Motilibacter deserti]|uniref:Thymidine kinase n=1 Tax=Motilibacter deserti TaxID=2714956 RepID=A0ABX0GUK6_9ACTN|nr:thymidine kinase [Motilibacter deserti]NHC13821.1 thymidine kinase [Motilibacter deserti]